MATKSKQSWVKYEEITPLYGKFTAEPLDRGSGTTLGNSLRRVLLSSLTGAAPTSVRIEGLAHEYSTIPGMLEDVLDMILNLKGIVFISHSKTSKAVKIDFKGIGEVTAKDIEHDDEIKIVNPKHHIATLNKKGRVIMDITVEQGKGYVPAELNAKPDQPIGTIPLDASFSPVVKVNHHVENIRVGKTIDYDKLTLEVWTNGSIKPDEAVVRASEILKKRVNMFLELNKKHGVSVEEETGRSETGTEEEISGGRDKADKTGPAYELTIEDLELSARSSNCLKKAGISKVLELIEKDVRELMQIKNFGKKSADEINEKLAQYGLALKIDENDILPEEND